MYEPWYQYGTTKGQAVLRSALQREASAQEGFWITNAYNHHHVDRLNPPQVTQETDDLFQEFTTWKEHGGISYTSSHYSSNFYARSNYQNLEITSRINDNVLYIYGNGLSQITQFVLAAGGWPLKKISTLVIGNTDHSIRELCLVADIAPPELFNLFECEHIYAVNNDMPMLGIKSLPIGFPSFANTHMIERVINRPLTRINKIFVAMKENNSVRGRIISACKRYADIFEVVTHRLEYQDYLARLSSYTHALCIPGQGLDTYRIWESLALGTIPVCPAIHPLKEFCLASNCFGSIDTFIDDCKRILDTCYYPYSSRLVLRKAEVIEKIKNLKNVTNSVK
jgi:hypothetical protein